MRVFKFCIFFFFLSSVSIYSQNTVGTIYYDEEASNEGYTLLYPLSQANIYLINNCGQVVHAWEDLSEFRPGNSVYLLPEGNLLKTKKPNGIIEGSFSAGGSGGIVEMRSWDNELLWSTEVMDNEFRAHHDVEILPNGNVLIIAWQRRSRAEYLNAGGDTLLYNRDEIWPDVIQEYDPKVDSVIWLWDSWDHLVQDYDSTLVNYGNISENSDRINLNYDMDGIGGRPDWLHTNSIDYNEELDQILLSSLHFEEIWVIDHSTTTEEARGSTGGDSGKGGSLLFRWGNPRAYDSGEHSDQKLFSQHDARWLDDPSISNSDYYQNIGIFNNRIENDISSINIIEPIFSNNEYLKSNAGVYLPFEFSFSLESNSEVNFQSSNMSSLQLLSNGNFLLCASQSGTVLELTPESELLWEYVIPFRNGFRVDQGSSLNTGDNVLFRAWKYEAEYEAFNNKTLEPQYYLESNPSELFCDTGLGLNVLNDERQFNVFPNPSKGIIYIEGNKNLLSSVQLINYIGKEVFLNNQLSSLVTSVDVSNIQTGLYFLLINGKFGYTIVVTD